MAFTEFEGIKKVTETIGDQAASMLRPLINQTQSSVSWLLERCVPVVCCCVAVRDCVLVVCLCVAVRDCVPVVCLCVAVKDCVPVVCRCVAVKDCVLVVGLCVAVRMTKDMKKLGVAVP